MQEVPETGFQSLGREESLEEEAATHSRSLAWRVPWTEDLVGYSPRGLKELDNPNPNPNPTQQQQHSVKYRLLVAQW